MSIKPVDLSVIQRTSEVGQVKQQHDSKPIVEQQNIQTEMVKKEEKLAHQVIETEHSQKVDTHADAKEESKNKYFMKKKKKTKVQEKESQVQITGRVIRKKAGGDFDLKI
uniref:hypothetical protein n=1 Tax=Agathobacter sp. TaxID=2021311 RepID=UPI0040575AFF